MPYTAAEIARRLEGELIGDGSVVLHRFAAADAARPGDLTFAENVEYFARAEQSAASAILVSGPVQSAHKALIRVPNARVAFARILPLFFPEPTPVPGVHPTAVVAKSAQIDPSASVGPHCVVGEQVRLGARVALLASVSVGDACVIGDDTRVFPLVSIYAQSQIGCRVRIHSGTVIGSDGYGYVFDQGRHLKVPQVGNVMIHDDVEIGANVTIDRGALGSTIIGRGAKIDNLVQVAHNVVIGEHSLLVSQVGIAGSSKVGNYVTLAGQVGIAGHLTIGNYVTVGAQGGVMNDIPDGQKWLGSPARPDKQMKRMFIAMERLPDLLHRVAELERRLEELGKARATEP